MAAFEPAAVVFTPLGPLPLEGHGNLGEFVGDLSSLFLRLSWRQDSVFVAGDGAAVKWTARGTRRDRRETVFEGIDVFEVTDAGRIRTLWSYWEPADMTWS